MFSEIKTIFTSTSGYSLFQGINLDVSALGSGTYVLKIESENYVDALKFIKAN